ncbi:unnamed protein product [Closterium sp. NIES-65]|nr:unnamed protein product [Closterium sp. NIES-65]
MTQEWPHRRPALQPIRLALQQPRFAARRSTPQHRQTQQRHSSGAEKDTNRRVPATTVPATIPSAIVTPAAVTPSTVTPSVPTTSVPTTTPPTTVTPTASAKHPSISTHVLDVTRGRPAAGIKVLLEKQIQARKGSKEVESETGGSGESGGVRLGWERVGEGVTNADGRAAGLLAGGGVGAGIYRLSFATGEYLGLMHGTRVAGNAQVSSGNGGGFFPSVSIVFQVLPEQEREHFHVPLLLSPFSYSTYRGS